MSKLSIDDQVKRIKQILTNENIITCVHCKRSYLPMNDEYEYICPICDADFDDIELDLCELLREET